MPWPSNDPPSDQRPDTRHAVEVHDDPWPDALAAAEKENWGPLALVTSNPENLATLPPHLARFAFLIGYGGLTTRGKYYFVMRDYNALMASEKLTRDQATDRVVASWFPEPVRSIVTRSKSAKVRGSANVADARRTKKGQT